MFEAAWDQPIQCIPIYNLYNVTILTIVALKTHGIQIIAMTGINALLKFGMKMFLVSSWPIMG